MVNRGTHTFRLMETTASGVSMSPIIRPRASIFIDISSKQIYSVGDIVVYMNFKGDIVAHRILLSIISASGGQQYLLKGDNNIRLDRYIDEHRLFGKVCKIVYPSYSINLNSVCSMYMSRLIAKCGRFAIMRNRFYYLWRLLVSGLTFILIWCARLKYTHRGNN